METLHLPDDAHRRTGGLFVRLLAGAAGLAGAGLGLYTYARHEPRWLDVNPVRLTLPRLTPAFDGYRVVQLSDLHMELWRDWATLDEVVERVNALEPDLIVITGDFVDESIRGIESALCLRLSRLRARDGVLAILGNHDYWDDGDAVRAVLAEAGLVDVSNRVFTLRRGDDRLHVCGVDSVTEMRARLDLVMRELPDDGAAILLAHEPDFAFVSAANGRFDMQLSGHSHGGQVRVPLLMELVLPPMGRRFIMGHYRLNQMHVYVNRGLGISGMRMRFRCRPEVTVLTLNAPAVSAAAR